MIEPHAAIDIARAQAAESGWAFAEPAHVRYRRPWFCGAGSYDIEIDAGDQGTKAWFTVDAKTGAVRDVGCCINDQAAIDIARARADRNGWGFVEPVDLVHYRPSSHGTAGHYEIVTYASHKGTKARFTINAATGKVTDQGYIPR